MSKSRRELSAEEKKLWRRVAATVKPHRAAPAENDTAAPPLRAKSKPAPPAPAPHRSSATITSLPPADRGSEKRVRRGRIEIGATLDLHGHTQDSGRAALMRFLRAAQARGDRAVIVVTGVGRGGAGVLKRRLPEWLAEPELRPLTSGFAQAHRTHGGAGAFYVFVKRSR